MAAVSADRNLLFGVLAVQLDFVSRNDLIAATSRWVLDKEQPLSDVFVSLGMLSVDESQLIDGVVKKHLERNGDNPKQSLHALEAFGQIRDTLKDLRDTALQHSVEFETLGTLPDDPYVTQSPPQVQSTDSRQRFTFLRVHQKGGLGCVSVARDEELNREIALKEILPAHADNVENRNRFIREAEITGALEHPGVVPVYSLGQFADGRPFYAMRFIHGVNLQDAIKDYYKRKSSPGEKQLEFRQLIAITIHVCHALDYAHSRGVIHRDIKPSNIMLGDYGETLVVDWGLAKTFDGPVESDDTTIPLVQTTQQASSTSTQIGRVVGTPSYMSPEQAAGRLDSLGPTSDIYSLGATLYQILTGQAAFQGNEDEVLGNVQMGRFQRPRELNPRVPRALEAICLKAMARLPRDRYRSAREMADDLERYLGDERVLAYGEPFPAKAWRWVRNHKPLVLSSAAALAVALAALTIGVILLSAANVRERNERERAERNFAEATSQQRLAERNFELARSAVHDFFVDVSENTLLQQPGLQDLREELLRQALVYYQSFLKQRQDDASLRKEVAEAHFFAGTIVQTIESPQQSLEHFLRAAELQKHLLEEQPDQAELRSGYGQTLNAMGSAYFSLGKIEEARDYFQKSAAVREELAETAPEDLESARTFANSVMNVGSTYLVQGALQQAIPLLERAQMVRMAHVDQLDTTVPKLQRDLGMGYYQLALVRRELGDEAVAESNFISAIDLFSRLLSAEPNDMSHQRNLALSYRGLADLKAGYDDPAGAVENMQKAREILDELKIRNPDVHKYAAELGGVYVNLAHQLYRLNQTDDALAAAKRAVELLQELAQVAVSMPVYQLDLGVALRFLGKLQGEIGQMESARENLLASKAVLSQLLAANPTSDAYAQALGLTVDALAALEGAGTKESAAEQPPSVPNLPGQPEEESTSE